MKNRVFKNYTLLYLSGLQFMAVAVWPAAMLTAESMKGEARDLLEKIEQPGAVPLDLIMHSMAEHLSLRPFQVILQEVSGLLHWGYYYSFYSDGSTLVSYTHLDYIVYVVDSFFGNFMFVGGRERQS